ncbi:hypothetical protein V8G54_031949 [Vigna mungo]|uniref:very-long-chain 3-oxoacyl-CoA synthase n=1 Tax=Vigna mungo TaxID=3915 RepID=A0AAQ3RG92_VIGMU
MALSGTSLDWNEEVKSLRGRRRFLSENGTCEKNPKICLVKGSAGPDCCNNTQLWEVWKEMQFRKDMLRKEQPKKSGIGDETYLPKGVFRPGHQNPDTDSKTTPSLSSMIVNHFKLRHDIHSFNLGGMGCGAGITAIDLAKDLLDAYPRTYALVVSTEAVSSTWYSGNDIEMQLPNCFFRMGAAAIVLSNFRLDRWRAKYELKQLVRIHKGMNNRSYKSVHQKEDSEGRKGLYVSKDIIEVGGHALKANITTLGPLVLPVSEQLHFFTNLVFKKKKTKPYIPDYKLAFEHMCILATSKKVLDEIQKNLELTEEYMEASRKTLERFGNTSSSSIWYQLAYLEFNSRIKRGDRVCQIASGAGFMCNSVVWKALRNVRKPNHSPWIEDQS